MTTRILLKYYLNVRNSESTSSNINPYNEKKQYSKNDFGATKLLLEYYLNTT